MHISVAAIWKRFSEPLEGRVHWMYLDIKGLVTTGVGNLIDSPDSAVLLPWKHLDGEAIRPATPTEIDQEWRHVKGATWLAKAGHGAAARETTLRLRDADIDRMVTGRLLRNESILRDHFPSWDELPADAQLCVLSMAWACGANFPVKVPGGFPKFTAAINRWDWQAAQAECEIRATDNPGVVPRNIANKLCLYNAEQVMRWNLDRAALWWPRRAVLPPDPTVAQAVVDVDWDRYRQERDAAVRERFSDEEDE